MEAAGVVPVEPIADKLGDGKLIRFRAEGDKPGRDNAWAVLHLDERPAGAFGSYRLGLSLTWRADRERVLSGVELAVARTKWAEARAERDRQMREQHAQTARYAQRLWGQCQEADPRHAYLVRKRIGAEGIRQQGDRLVVPMTDAAGSIWNIQRIDPIGGKRFLKSGRTSGLMWICGNPDAEVVIGEGVATVAAVRRATGMAVIAAFSANNLEAVARAVRERWRDARIVIAADDDAHLLDHPTITKNIGLEAARAAAAAVGGVVAVPPRGEK